MIAIIFDKSEKEKFAIQLDFWNRIEPIELENGEFFISDKCYKMMDKETKKELGGFKVRDLKEEDFKKPESIDIAPTK